MALWWQDRSGAFAPVRAAALALSVAPALWIGAQAVLGWLGPRPITEAIHQCGDWSIRLLLATLAVSPLRRIIHWPRLIGARQVFGLAALAYAALHVGLYVADLKFDLGKVLSEIVQRVYLGIGSIAFVGLLILGRSSGVAAVRRLGAAEWTRLHALVHPIAALALLHFFIQKKLDVTEPLLLTGFAVWLWGYRRLQRRDSTEAPALVGLAVAASIATLAVQLAWYGLATRVTTSAILSGLLDFEYEINVIWYVLGITLAVALARWLIARSDRVHDRRTPETGRRAVQAPGVQGV